MQCQKSTVELVPPGSILLGTNAMAKAKLPGSSLKSPSPSSAVEPTLQRKIAGNSCRHKQEAAS